MRNTYRIAMVMAIGLFAAACGNVAMPRYEADRIIAEAQEDATQIVASAQAQTEGQSITEPPTEAPTEIPTEVPSATPLPTEAPTEVPTEVPSATPRPTEAPTEVPPTQPPTTAPTVMPTSVPPTIRATTSVPTTARTVVPTEVPAVDTSSEGTAGREAEIKAAVDAGDAVAGQTLFLQTGCSGCHMVDSEITIVGPGLAGVFNRGSERVPGLGAYEYVFTSIRDSQAFVVDGFTPGLMPQYADFQLSDEAIYSIMAYLHSFSN